MESVKLHYLLMSTVTAVTYRDRGDPTAGGGVSQQQLRFNEHLNFTTSFAKRSWFSYIISILPSSFLKSVGGGGVTPPHALFGTPLCKGVVVIGLNIEL